MLHLLPPIQHTPDSKRKTWLESPISQVELYLQITKTGLNLNDLELGRQNSVKTLTSTTAKTLV